MSPARLSPSALKLLVADLFTARGLSREHAALVADNLVWADQRGIPSHGVGRVPRYFEFLDKGTIDPAAVPRVGMSAGAVYRVDGNKAAGAVGMALAMEHGARVAAEMGVSFGVLADTTHVGSLGYFADAAARRGLLAVLWAAGSPLMAYHGSKVASLHTAPIAFGLPTDGEPVVLDMATSLVANGRLQQARDGGRPIPDDWALTADGRRTTDPAEAEILLPLGGPKGSGLALAFEMASGLLAGSPVLLAALAPEKKKRPSANVTLILVDIARFRPVADYASDASALVQLVKSLPRLDPDREILVPGERGARHMQSSRDTVAISAKTWARLEGYARALACAVPSPLG